MKLGFASAILPDLDLEQVLHLASRESAMVRRNCRLAKGEVSLF